jgi:hypothetical protein
MQPATQIAKSILHLKTPRARAFASGMGRNHRGPYDPLTCAKVSDACRFVKSLTAEARRYYLAERKAKWLTDVILEHGDHKTFDLAGVFEGRAYDIHIEMPLDATLLDFLLLVMRCNDAPMIMRLDCAKNAASLMYEKPRGKVVVFEYERPPSLAAAIPANPPVAEG